MTTLRDPGHAPHAEPSPSHGLYYDYTTLEYQTLAMPLTPSLPPSHGQTLTLLLTLP